MCKTVYILKILKEVNMKKTHTVSAIGMMLVSSQLLYANNLSSTKVDKPEKLLSSKKSSLSASDIKNKLVARADTCIMAMCGN
jgi:hypothetical protein